MRYKVQSSFYRPPKYATVKEKTYNKIVQNSEEVDIPEWMAEAYALWCHYFERDSSDPLDARLFTSQYLGDYDDINDFFACYFYDLWEFMKDDEKEEYPEIKEDELKASYIRDTFQNGYLILNGRYAFYTH